MLISLKKRIFKCFDVSMIYHTSAGIKSFNQLISSDAFVPYGSNSAGFVNTKHLRLGIDNLVDSYANIGKPVNESPHFELIDNIMQDKGIEGCDYFYRLEIGALDLRPPQKVKGTLVVNKTRADILGIHKSIMTGHCEPIKTIGYGNIKYIIDGKHRASLYHYLGIDALCIDVTHVINDSFFYWVYRLMRKRETDYSKHIRFFREFYGE